MIGGIGGGQKTTSLEEYAHQYVGVDDTGKIADASLRGEILSHRMNDRAFGLTTRRSVEESATGNAPGATSSMFKYYGTEQNIGKYDFCFQSWARNPSAGRATASNKTSSTLPAPGYVLRLTASRVGHPRSSSTLSLSVFLDYPISNTGAPVQGA